MILIPLCKRLGHAQTNGGVSLSQAPNAAVLLFISLAFGFSLAVNVWVFFRISGGEFHEQDKQGRTKMLKTYPQGCSIPLCVSGLP